MSAPPYEETKYGFKWGAADVFRIASDEKKGWVAIGINTPRVKTYVYVTRTGKLRFFVNGKEVKI